LEYDLSHYIKDYYNNLNAFKQLVNVQKAQIFGY
jgi:hypothetical protein